MASGSPNGQLIAANTRVHFYPAYCNKASPTYFTWVKLTASDIHYALRSRPDYAKHLNNISYRRHQSPNPTSLLFYLNHPIQFVCIVGIVVAFDEHDRCWVFTVDDSSGATIDVTCHKLDKSKEQAEHKSLPWNGNAALAQAAVVETSGNKDDGTIVEARVCVEALSRIDIGSVVKVKGTVSTFRSVRQITLKRLEVVSHTNAEVRFWTQRTQLLTDVLSKPWILSAEMQKQLLKEADGEDEDNTERAARRVERLAKERRREKRHAEKIANAYEIEERERKRVAANMRQCGLELRVESEKREQERTVEEPKGEKRAQLGETAFDARVTNLRELVSSKWIDR